MSPLTTSEVGAPKVLDIQHDTDPAQDHGPAKHIPHIGHALLFFIIAWLSLSLCVLAVLAAAHLHTEEQIKAHQGLAMLGQAASYVLTLAVAWVALSETVGLLVLAGHRVECPGSEALVVLDHARRRRHERTGAVCAAFRGRAEIVAFGPGAAHAPEVRG